MMVRNKGLHFARTIEPPRLHGHTPLNLTLEKIPNENEHVCGGSEEVRCLVVIADEVNGSAVQKLTCTVLTTRCDDLDELEDVLAKTEFQIVVASRASYLQVCASIKRLSTVKQPVLFLMTEEADSKVVMNALTRGVDIVALSAEGLQEAAELVKSRFAPGGAYSPECGERNNGAYLAPNIGLEDNLQILCGELSRLRKVNTKLTTELKKAETELRDASFTDSLTGLLNRRGFEGLLQRETERARRTGNSLISLLVTLTNYQKIKNSLGHSVGDLVVKELGKKLRAELRNADAVARLDGSSFLLLLSDTRLAEARSIAERIRLNTNESSLEVSSAQVELCASVTVAEVPMDTASVDDLLSRSGIGFSGLESAAASEGNDTVTRVTETLRKGEQIRTLAQSIHWLEDESMTGFELLTRGPAGDFENPVDFFRLAYEQDILAVVDRHCLRACIETASTMLFDGCFHINVFPATMLDTPVQRLLDMFSGARNVESFCLEISEQQILGDPTYLHEPVKALKEAGIKIAIDDVGFGRSCLESLIILEPDVVKIDRKYVNGVANDGGRKRQLERLFQVATSLGAEMVAEGIEYPEDLRFLQTLGVKFGQGYLWCKPSDPQSFQQDRQALVFK